VIGGAGKGLVCMSHITGARGHGMTLPGARFKADEGKHFTQAAHSGAVEQVLGTPGVWADPEEATKGR